MHGKGKKKKRRGEYRDGVMKGSLRWIFSIRVSVRLFSSYQNEVGISKSVSWGAALCSFAPNSNQNNKRETQAWSQTSWLGLHHVYWKGTESFISLLKQELQWRMWPALSLSLSEEQNSLEPSASNCCDLHQNSLAISIRTHTHTNYTDLVAVNDVHNPGTSLCLAGIKPAERSRYLLVWAWTGTLRRKTSGRVIGPV